MIKLIVEPGQTYSWRDFLSQKPPFSIALDGIVNAQTKRKADPAKPYANFDHHTGCDRIATRSTSEQVAIEINLGLFRTFRKDGIPTANLFANDVDEDVCLATWLLKNHERVEGHAEPAINRLVYCEDRLDATAGAYPLGDTAFRRQMGWIFEPYQRARYEGRLSSLTAVEMESIVEAVCARITAHTLNQGEELGLEGHYKRIGGGANWSMVEESGPAARLAMYNAGIEAFVAYLGPQGDNHRYVIGRKSVWVPWPLQKICAALNEADTGITDTNRWGGSDTIGGSPRQTGSSLNPTEMETFLCKYLEE